MDQQEEQEEHIHIIHTGPKLDPEECQHPAAKQYTWWATGLAGRILCAVCLQCNTVLAGAEDENTGYLECPECGVNGMYQRHPEGDWLCQACAAGPYIMTFEDKKVEPPEKARWHCPVCDKWAVKQIQKPQTDRPDRPAAWYTCTSCAYRGDGSTMLAAGRGGYRMPPYTGKGYGN